MEFPPCLRRGRCHATAFEGSCTDRKLAARSLAICWKSQSSPRRITRSDLYQGIVSPSAPYLHCEQGGTQTQVGTPKAPPRCATDVWMQKTMSRLATSAAVSS